MLFTKFSVHLSLCPSISNQKKSKNSDPTALSQEMNNQYPTITAQCCGMYLSDLQVEIYAKLGDKN
jgi:hypothetical protein